MLVMLGIFSLAAAVVGIIGTVTLVIMQNDTWKNWLLGSAIAMILYVAISILVPSGP
jgi:zinc transporter ZupT